MGAVASDRQEEELHRRGVRLEVFTITWNVVEAAVATGAGLLAGSVALVGFGVDSGIEVISAVALLWRLLKAGPEASAEEHGAAEKRARRAASCSRLMSLRPEASQYHRHRSHVDSHGRMSYPPADRLGSRRYLTMPKGSCIIELYGCIVEL